MAWLIGIGAVLVIGLALLGLDRAVARGWFDRRTPRAPRPASGPASSGMFGDALEIFQPNRQHLVAEQERQRLDIRQTGGTAPPLDLDSGVVRLERPAPGGPSPGA